MNVPSSFQLSKNAKHRENYPEPKHYFRTIAELMKARGVRSGRLIDPGCATGHFINFIGKEVPALSLTGIDIDPVSVSLAKERNPGIDFRLGDALDPQSFEPGGADITVMLGLHPIFDDIRAILTNAKLWTKRGGVIYLFGQFNTRPVDTIVRYRAATEKGDFHQGWNLHSIATTTAALDDLGLARKTFIRHEMPFEVPEDPLNPMFSWSERAPDGRQRFAVGCGIVTDMYVVEILRD